MSPAASQPIAAAHGSRPIPVNGVSQRESQMQQRRTKDAARGRRGACAAPLCLEPTVEALETGCSPPGRSLPLVTRTTHASTRLDSAVTFCHVPTMYLSRYRSAHSYLPRYQPILASLRIITAPQNDEITSGRRTDWVWAWTGTAVLGWPCQTGAGVAMGL
jgi:hypothetical protein